MVKFGQRKVHLKSLLKRRQKFSIRTVTQTILDLDTFRSSRVFIHYFQTKYNIFKNWLYKLIFLDKLPASNSAIKSGTQSDRKSEYLSDDA